jgi:hypothetical protein
MRRYASRQLPGQRLATLPDPPARRVDRSPARPFCCVRCPQRFASLHLLTEHVELLHADEGDAA